MKYLPLILLVFLTSCSTNSVKNDEAAVCNTLDSINSSHSPAEIFPEVSSCMSSGNYSEAADLYLVAQAFGQFDTYRVADKAGHASRAELKFEYIDTNKPKDIEGFYAAVNETINNPEIKGDFCSALISIGTPVYEPEYMWNNQTAALFDREIDRTTPESFNAESSWNEVLTHYIKCQL